MQRNTAETIFGTMNEGTATFCQWVRSASRAYGNDVAISLTRLGIIEEKLSFAELNEHSVRFAEGLLTRKAGRSR